MKHCILYLMLLVLPTMSVFAQQRHSDTFDDVLQHVPMATMLVMKACGVNNERTWTETLVSAAASYVVSAGVTYGLKHTVKEWRPDHSDQRSFPSGHATFAFAGATVLHHEYGRISPWISVGGYTLATLTAVDRVVRDRHHWYDVTAGAAIGVLGTEFSYFITRKIFSKRKVQLAFTGNQMYFAMYY